MERMAFAPGLMDEDAKDCALLASKCESCGTLFFPSRAFCLECNGGDMATERISGLGTLYTYTIVNMPSAHYAAPYAIGWIEFSGGLRVFGQIRAREKEPLEIGMKMRVLKGTLWQEDDKEIVGYYFEPIDGTNP